MASTRPLNVADMASSEEPAAKRQKLTSGADLSSTVSNSPTANTVTSTTASLTGDASASKTTTNKMSVYGDVSIVFQPEKEAEHGILCFVSPSNPGFSGILKQRYASHLYLCTFCYTFINIFVVNQASVIAVKLIHFLVIIFMLLFLLLHFCHDI